MTKLGKGQCEAKVSNGVSNVLGKQPCNSAARYLISGQNLCTKHTNAAKAQAYERLVSALRSIAKPALGGKQQQYTAQEILKELGED